MNEAETIRYRTDQELLMLGMGLMITSLNQGRSETQTIVAAELLRRAHAALADRTDAVRKAVRKAAGV